MARYRSLLIFILASITALLISCGSPAQTQAPTYTSPQLEQIQQYATDIQALRDRMPELATLIENREWTDVRTFIHAPFGELRRKMSGLTRTLLPNVQDQAQAAAKGVFGHLVEIDEAAENTDYRQAIRNYAEAIKDFDAFFQLIPQG